MSRPNSPAPIPISTTAPPVPRACASDDGRLALGSLACPGFAVAADMDFAAMRPMPAAPKARIVPAHPREAA